MSAARLKISGGNIQDWIAEARADIQAARLLTLHAAWKIDTAGAKSTRGAFLCRTRQGMIMS